MSGADPVSGRDLAAFVAALETGSVQRAADALNLTQSAVTKRLQALERRLDRDLLVRGAHGVAPTASGRLLYPDAKHALDALGRTEACLRTAETAAVLHIAASHTIGEFLLPEWLRAFRAEGCSVAAHVEIVNSPGVLEAMSDDRAEIGFVEGLEPLDHLERLLLRRDEIVVVVSRRHRWAESPEIPAIALPGEPFFSREAGSGTRAVASARLAEVGIELEPVLEVASSQSLKRSVAQGGFTLLSRLSIEEDLRSGALAAVRVVGVDLCRDLLAVRRRRSAHSPPASIWWDWLRARASGARRL